MAKVAVVSGGTRGIGAAISRALKAAGYTVVANYAGNDEAAAKHLAREHGGIGGGTLTEAAKSFAADTLALAPFNAAIAYVDNGEGYPGKRYLAMI